MIEQKDQQDRMPTEHRWRLSRVAIAVGLLLLSGVAACKRGAEDQANAESAPKEPPPHSKLVFPKELHVDDPSVNAFLYKAMITSTNDDYEAFRLLWSARHEPLPRAEFERGWTAVRLIRIHALEQVALVDDTKNSGEIPETSYATLADVELDPEQLGGRREPHRRVVLMIVREFDEWRLDQAPKKLRRWLNDKVEQQLGETARAEPESAPSEKP